MRDALQNQFIEFFSRVITLLIETVDGTLISRDLAIAYINAARKIFLSP